MDKAILERALLNKKIVATRREETKNGELLIGFTYNYNVWHYYMISEFDENWLWFDHSYSFNNGSTKKGTRQMLTLAKALEKMAAK